MAHRIVPFLVVAVLAVSGCTSTRQANPRDLGSPRMGELMDVGVEGQSIRSYATTDGIHHRFHGRVRLLHSDTLEFYRAKRRGGGWGVDYSAGAPEVRFRIPRDSVQTVYVVHRTAGGTVLTVLGVTVLIAAAALVIAIATKESCPFLYSYDGKAFVFDGEPYGGATMRALERTDWSELEHLRPVEGRYRLRIGNEVDETQHTNSLALRVVDHQPGTTVVLDKSGRPHAFRTLVPPQGARDEAGRDLLVWLSAKDGAAWQPDLKAYAERDTLEETRNHITLEFPRPKGRGKGYLVSNVATHSWGSHMIRTMLGMRGNRVREFYDAINDSPAYRAQLYAWNEREELFELFPEVETATGWERQDFIPAGGPFIGESRAVPLDWGRAPGDTIRIRIHPPIGFWSLESFHLAWDETETCDLRLSPEGAEGADGPAVLAALAADDSLYLDFPEVGDHALVAFRVPPPAPGLERVVFAETRGWYEVHLHDLGAPDSIGLARLATEPGYAVRRSLSEFGDYRRSGVLRGVKPLGKEGVR